jgi:hypothetical protein
VRAVVAGTVAATAAYGLYLLPSSAGVRPWVVASTILLAVVAVAAVVWALRPSTPVRKAGVALGLAAAALLVGAAWASGTSVAAGFGPFDSPYQPASLSAADQAARHAAAADSAALNRTAAGVPKTESIITAETSAAVSTAILETGREFLPIGGFTGKVPSPTLAQFVRDVKDGSVRLVMVAVSPRTHNPDMLWAVAHCQRVTGQGADQIVGGRHMEFFECSPADAGSVNS